MTVEDQKLLAAVRAIEYVEDGMKLGLGTGSTAEKFVDLLGQRVSDGLNVLCIPTSEATKAQAEELSIPLTDLDQEPYLDLTVDGADELDSELRLIKGGGGALLREKIVAMASDRMIVIADSSKHVQTLGRFPLPVEIVPFGATATKLMIEELAESAGCRGDIVLRQLSGGAPYLSDSGNYILDCAFGRIRDPDTLEETLAMIPGVVESGLFINVADIAVVAGPEGVTILEAPEDAE
ncbi:MAG: ribose-5-phosphate isomerase RpiA [Methyloligellaceae bacterium]